MINENINELTKEQLIDWIKISHHVYGSKFFSAIGRDKYEILYKDLTWIDRFKIVWRVAKFFLIDPIIDN